MTGPKAFSGTIRSVSTRATLMLRPVGLGHFQQSPEDRPLVQALRADALGIGRDQLAALLAVLLLLDLPLDRFQPVGRLVARLALIVGQLAFELAMQPRHLPPAMPRVGKFPKQLLFAQHDQAIDAQALDHLGLGNAC